MKNQSVIVVGAGPVGVLNALGLARSGVEVTVLERERTIVNSPRAMVYHWAVMEGLERLGVLEEALRRGFEKQDYSYRVHATGEFIHWDLKPLDGLKKYPYNLHLGQHVLAEIAHAELAKLPNATVQWGAAVTGVEQDADAVTVRFESGGVISELRADWVIGADGAGSAVRRSLGVEFEGFTWPERFVATDLRYDFEAHGYGPTVLQIDPVYGAVIAKIDTSGLWRVTYMESDDEPVEGILDRMPHFMREILPGGGDYELVQYSPYRMHQRSAAAYRVGRVLLAGDSAHATNPVGGYGLTSGLFDTFVLYPALAAVIAGDASESVLDEYAEKRRRMFLDVVSPSASANKDLVFGCTDPVKLQADLDKVHEMISTEEGRLKRALFPGTLETPSLIGDQSFAAN